jgi:hypothetical protein
LKVENLMAFRTPEIVDGARAPRPEREAEAKAKRQPGGGFAVIPEGKRVVQFTHARYRLQLTAPTEQKDSEGRVSRKKAIVVVADEGLKILDKVKDKFAIDMIFGNPDEGIEPHSHLGTDFWDFADVIKSAKNKKVTAAKELLADPEARAEILAALAESEDEGFDVPAHELPSQRSENKPADVE